MCAYARAEEVSSCDPPSGPTKMARQRFAGSAQNGNYRNLNNSFIFGIILTAFSLNFKFVKKQQERK
jgi:hypothetical protein